jgi:2-dehydropantoate 2-reductase
MRLQEQGGVKLQYEGVTSTATGFKSDVFNLPIHPTQLGRLARNKLLRDALFEEPDEEPAQETQTTGSSRTRDREEPGQVIESLILATKSSSTIQSFAKVAHRLRPSSTVVMLQTGMGIYEELVHTYFPYAADRPHFIIASHTHSIRMKQNFHVVQREVGQLRFAIVPDARKRDFEAGLSDPDVQVYDRRANISDITVTGDEHFHHYKSLRNTVAALLLMEALTPKWVAYADIQVQFRRNLVVDTVINSLSALMNCRVGDIFSSSSAALGVMRSICKEASRAFELEFKEKALAQADPSQTSIEPFPDDLSTPALEAACLREAELKPRLIAPFLADIRRGEKTDVRYLNGYLVRLGRVYRADVKVTHTLLQLLRMRSAIPLDQQF